MKSKISIVLLILSLLFLFASFGMVGGKGLVTFVMAICLFFLYSVSDAFDGSYHAKNKKK